MVKAVTRAQNNSSPQFFPFSTILLKLPWERVIGVGGGLASVATLRQVKKKGLTATPASPPIRSHSNTARSPTNTATPAPLVSSLNPNHRPGLGCTVADNSILAQGHLEGLAKGYGGWGVLRVSKEKLEEAASAADRLGRGDLSARIRVVAEELPTVHDEKAAAATARKLDGIVSDSWRLGQVCKGAVQPAKLRALAKEVADGKLTLKEAIDKAKEL